MKNEPQVMTIVRNSPTDEPMIISSNLPGSVAFRENEVNFLREMLTYLENDSKERRQQAERVRSISTL
ncbi:MAG: hypothetical protein HFJ26_08220 [Clostridia bacterium]|nr:hypothetical protein [Clostridia bacterium]